MQPASFLEFAHKWSASKRTERAAAQEHFIDLCRLLGEPTPVEADPTGETYAFEKAVTKTGGSAGFADVWRRGHFAWEYKGKHHDLAAAYDQLLTYREGLDNPPLLVVCDLDRFEVHTNFTDTAKQVYKFDLADLATTADSAPGTPFPPLEVIRAIFKEPDRLRPRQTLAHVTERAAAEFARLSASLRGRGEEPGVAARFLVRLLFCLFAEDIGLLPDNLFTRLVDQTRHRPAEFVHLLGQLFRTMAAGGYFGVDHIEYFNGGLFADDQVLNFTTDLEKGDAGRGAERNRHQRAAHQALLGFADELAATRILDPAAGSGNFLYLALRRLMDLEKEAISFALVNGLQSWFPKVNPEQLHGIEVNPYAHELAQAVVWIGYIQWLRDNGFGRPSPPILKPLVTIELMDALLAQDNGQPVEPDWPQAEVIIGNPPFLGGKRMRSELGDKYVDDLFRVYEGRVPRESDLVTYWFERARALIAAGRAQRAGLLATNSIRGGASRRVLDHVKRTGDIFLAWSDHPWILEGAAVRVSIVGFDRGDETVRTLDGAPVLEINPDLTGALNLTAARRLQENAGLAFMGDTKGGAFDITGDVAMAMLSAPLNPNGRGNADVLRPWVNGLDVTRRPRGMWIIDFGVSASEAEAALFELPYKHVFEHVRPEREKNSRATYRERWWLHAEARPAMRNALKPLRRFIGTPTVARHRLFVWLEHPTLPDHQLIAIARQDDYFLGVLQSKLHELWALRLGSWLGVGNDPRYTPTTTFETFPFPWTPGEEPPADSRVEAIAEATRTLVTQRDRWLNPPGASEETLRTRTLTSLYNARPMWLQMAHERLDRAVLNAYGWLDNPSDAELLERLFARNRERAEAEERAGGQLPLPEPAVVGKERFRRRTRRMEESSHDETSPSRGRGRRRPA